MSAISENGLKGLTSTSLPLLVAVVPRTECNFNLLLTGTNVNSRMIVQPQRKCVS